VILECSIEHCHLQSAHANSSSKSCSAYAGWHCTRVVEVAADVAAELAAGIHKCHEGVDVRLAPHAAHRATCPEVHNLSLQRPTQGAAIRVCALGLCIIRSRCNLADVANALGCRAACMLKLCTIMMQRHEPTSTYRHLVIIWPWRRQRLKDDSKRHARGLDHVRRARHIVQRQPHVARAGISTIPHLHIGCTL
jgi:hypothetical protein